MKKIILSFLFISLFSINSYSQTTGNQTNAVLEYCTGTWCQYCPCGHVIIDGILSNYPNTMVLGYHGGGSSDPWLAPSAGMISMFGFSAYPTGVVGRKTTIIDRGLWNNKVIVQTFATPTVTINISGRTYNAAARSAGFTMNATANIDLTGNYFVNFVLTEDNLIYSQTGNSGCTGASVYHHEHVVKAMVNGNLGEALSSGGTWMTGAMLSKSLVDYVLPADVVPDNCRMNVFIYKQGTNISTDYDVQQSIFFPVSTTTGIGNNNGTVSDYSLSQNYPNPFNPVTNIRYSIPTDGNVTFKVYDMLGNEVGTYVNEVKKAGIYSVTFDGANLASGIYYYKLESNNFSETKKMMLVK